MVIKEIKGTSTESEVVYRSQSLRVDILVKTTNRKILHFNFLFFFLHNFLKTHTPLTNIFIKSPDPLIILGLGIQTQES